MSSILVTGANGFIGAELVRQLGRDARYEPVAAFRSKTVASLSNVHSISIGNLEDDIDWSLALSGIDVVIHTAARVHIMNDSNKDPLVEYRKVNFEGTMNLARKAVNVGVRRFIFISSIKVNGEETVLGRPFTADDEPDPVDPYGISKSETEAALLELADSTGLEVVIIRPVLVYGPGVKANFLSLLNWMYKRVPLPLGSIHNKRSFLALGNLVDLVITCIDHPKAVNQVFLASDGHDLSTTELLQRISDAMGIRPRLIPVPEAMIRFAFNLVGKRDLSQKLLGSLQVDITETRLLLDWEPPLSVDGALRETVQSFLMKD